MQRWLVFVFLCVIGISCTSDSIYFKDPNLTPEEEEELNRCLSIEKEIFLKFTKKMRSLYGLEAMGVGGLGNKTNHFDLSFNCYKKMDLMQARKLLIESTQEFLEEINMHKDLNLCVCSWPFTYKNVNIEILFEDRNKIGEFIQAPLMAFVSLAEGKCVYYIKSDRLKRIKEETFEEALAALDQD